MQVHIRSGLTVVKGRLTLGSGRGLHMGTGEVSSPEWSRKELLEGREKWVDVEGVVPPHSSPKLQ